MKVLSSHRFRSGAWTGPSAATFIKFDKFRGREPLRAANIVIYSSVRLLAGPLSLNLAAAVQLCVSVRSDGDCGKAAEDISLRLKEEASGGGRALSGSKGPSRHLGLDKRTWQISK